MFASASQTWMDDVAAKTGVTARTDFVTNRLVIITPSDDPAGIGSLDDLANPGVQVVLAAEGVPVGDYAREALTNARIDGAVLANVVSNAEDDAAVVATIMSDVARRFWRSTRHPVVMPRRAIGSCPSIRCRGTSRSSPAIPKSRASRS